MTPTEELLLNTLNSLEESFSKERAELLNILKKKGEEYSQLKKESLVMKEQYMLMKQQFEKMSEQFQRMSRLYREGR